MTILSQAQEKIEFQSPLIGQKIPDLTLPAYHHEQILKKNLRDNQSRWTILFFYPADFTFVCPTELEELAERYEDFTKINAEIMSVSTDTVYVHKAWHDTSNAVKKIQFPMLSDTNAVLSRSLGVYALEEGLCLRASFIVDPDSTIQAYEVHANNVGRSARELLRKLQAAKFVREHGDNVCPASWEPGKETLKPGLDLVGKI